MSTPISLNEVIHEIVSNILLGVHTSIPAKVERFDSDKLLIDATPSIHFRHHDGTVTKIGTIYNIPICYPRSADSIIYFPLKKGDSVLLVVAEKSIDEWMENSNKAPDDPRTYCISDAFAIPGVYPAGAGAMPSNKESMCINFKGQSIEITKDGNIKLGAGTLQGIVLKAYKQEIDKYMTALQVFMTSAVASTNPYSVDLKAFAGEFQGTCGVTFIAPTNSLTTKTKAE
jgi:hypothetical protein